ncbi:MAG: amino acid ABC transporter permease [Halofilum sp. (in: g-proteobacteria)]
MVLDFIAPIFRGLREKTGFDFVVFYEPDEFGRYVEGLSTSLQLMFWSIALSLIVGVLGAWARSSRSRTARCLVSGYIQLFRNTPPMVQMLFFYFALGSLTPTMDMGGYEEPMISAFAWAVISLGVFGGAFNAEIFRSGLEAVPDSTREAAESLCMTRLQIFRHVTMPLALRISLPALTANLVSLAKWTSLAYVISVPELTFTLNQVWSDNLNTGEMMIVLFFSYVIIVTLFAAVLHRLERRLALPGYGQ